VTVVEPADLEPLLEEPVTVVEPADLEPLLEEPVTVFEPADLEPLLEEPETVVEPPLDELQLGHQEPAAAPEEEANRSAWWFRRRHRQPETLTTPSPIEAEEESEGAGALAPEGPSSVVLEEIPTEQTVELAQDPTVVEEAPALEDPEPLALLADEAMAHHVEPSAEAPVEPVPVKAAAIEAIEAEANDSLQTPVETDSLDVPTWLTDSIASAFPAPPSVSDEPIEAEETGAEPGAALDVEPAPAEVVPPAIAAFSAEPHQDDEEAVAPTSAILEELRAHADPEAAAAAPSTLSSPNERTIGLEQRKERTPQTITEPLHEFDQSKGRKRFGLFKRPKKDEQRDDVATTTSFASGSGQRSSPNQFSSSPGVSAETTSRPARGTARRPEPSTEPEVRAPGPSRPSAAVSTARAAGGNGQAPQVAAPEFKKPRQRDGAKRSSQQRTSARSATPRTLRCSSCGEPSEQGICQVCRDALTELQGLSLFEEN
jgi:hypothetical protein